MIVALPLGLVVIIDIAVWAVWGTLVGYVAHRLPDRWLEHDGAVLRLRRFERDRRFYERTLHIRRWKARVPELGALFGGGFSKRDLRARDRAFFDRFVIETRRAEITHWWVLAAGPCFLIWNPWWLGLIMIGYGVVANLPCVLIQRYNRARLERVLGRENAST